MYRQFPDNVWWMQAPLLLMIVVSLWGLIGPRSQWRITWSRSGPYRYVDDPREQVSMVRRRSTLVLILCVVMSLLFWLKS